MQRNRLLPLAVLVLGAIVVVPWPARAQGTITGVMINPSPACVNAEVTARVQGTGSCQDVRLTFDFQNLPVETALNPTFPVNFTHTYTAAGTYDIRAGSQDPNCSGSAQKTLEVKNCTPQIDAEMVQAFLDSMRPKIKGGLGLVQPGNPFPILIWGEKFGSTTGKIFLEGQFGTVQLPILEWGSDGKFASANIPAGICGVPDHQASIWIQTASGWISNKWPANFTAARDVLPLPRNEMQVISCSPESSKDCCNSQCDPDDNDYFAACISPSSSICGYHMQPWGAIGDDEGTDTYRVDISGGSWVIEGWSFQVSADPDEAWAQFQPGNAFQEKIADFNIPWMVSSNDSVTYDSVIFISGPCGTSHKPGVAQSALVDAGSLLNAGQFSQINSAAIEKLKASKDKIAADARRKASAENQRLQHEMTRLHAAATGQAVADARALDDLQREGMEIMRLNASPSSAQSGSQLSERARRLRDRLRALIRLPTQ
jgi:PKD domain